ncbi:hypothetical protein BJX76DRAFT_358071 [Aspergillus varians]
MPYQSPHCPICVMDAKILCYQVRHLVTYDLCGGDHAPPKAHEPFQCGNIRETDVLSESSDWGSSSAVSDDGDSQMEDAGQTPPAPPQCLRDRGSKLEIELKDHENDIVMGNTQEAGVQTKQGSISKSDVMKIENASLELHVNIAQSQPSDEDERILEIAKFSFRASLASLARTSSLTRALVHQSLYTLNDEQVQDLCMWVSFKGQEKTMLYVLDDILRVNESDSYVGFDALVSAARGGGLQVLRKLVDKGIRPDFWRSQSYEAHLMRRGTPVPVA